MWLNRAAAAKDGGAMLRLGVLHQKGEAGFTPSNEEAMRWFRRGAELNDARCLLATGMMYVEGAGVPADSVEAVKWIRRSAERNDATAMFMLGVAYRQGEGVAKDLDAARDWFAKSLRMGYEPAREQLKQLK
jgi:TPR repeat protein